ncbi:phosphatase PAP2 family protein [Pseudomonas typographi]|uniref:Phosphatase PAP2 family protein n=1 Tax=Pseudomonas typographi TaxID=2715964 RepID=A0ABR7Z3H8_9PSED|nr:phosphatase PAP2 family protein [Pseudomonas typographi]MBD1550126.1 phosphatase PAP2 family protein [Pseudomonas typographi]MBD1586114.1 phosphatase PAP2 family protein [Pseudomonas typographi]MBD1599972.1 phosphatase PAP2 family protein [Pseudomonas typographi]
MNKPGPFQARWNASGLIFCNIAALALLCLWLWPTTHNLMAAFDEGFYRLLNQPLASNAAWRYIWTAGSLRPFDAVVGLILLFLLIRGGWAFEAAQLRQGFWGFVAVLLLLVAVRTLFSKLCDGLGWQHDSVSMMVPDAVHLSDWYPHLDKTWQLKDQSSNSFPGDHASVLLIWAMYISVSARRAGPVVVAWALAVLFSMPRLVAGAHWAQDDYIGGLLMALLALGWGYYTPFVAHASQWLTRVTAPVFRLLQRVPLINRLSVVSA